MTTFLQHQVNPGDVLRTMVRGRRLVVTVFVLLLAGLMVWAGFWQWGRLGERRATNARISALRDTPPIPLLETGLDPMALEYQPVEVTGTWDFENEVVLRNREREGRAGVHVLTPLRLPGRSDAVLVDRGWIPNEMAAPDQREMVRDIPEARVIGIVQRPQSRRGWLSPPELPLSEGSGRRDAWLRVDVAAIEAQMPYPLLPLWIEAQPDPNAPVMPWRDPPPPLSEGSHFSYALQWWSFALILLTTYTAFVAQSTKNLSSPQKENRHL